MSANDSRFPLHRPSVSQRISRRKVLLELVALAGAGSTLTWLEGCGSTAATPPLPPTATSTLYPNLTGRFGSVLTVGEKADFPAAKPSECMLNHAGIFYRQEARTYIVHLDKATAFTLAGSMLEHQLAAESIITDTDGSYWLAVYQRCVHLGCTVAFRDDCVSFKCPCHGAQFQCDGAYLDGPAPRSMDRFALSFQGNAVVVDTGRLNTSVLHPDTTTRLIPVPTVACSF